MKNSKIEWTDHTFNPWIGCTKVSPGCANCYAESLDHRWGHDSWGKGAPRRRTSAANWKQPLKWNNGEERMVSHDEFVANRRPRVFCASLADWLDDEVPIEWLADLLDLIRLTPNLDWLLLTKRPQNWRKRLSDWGEHTPPTETQGLAYDWLRGSPPANVWIGTSVEDQARADERIPHLLDIPARVRFLSMEPLLGRVKLPIGRVMTGFPKHVTAAGHAVGAPLTIHWVIVGGESGPHARPMHPDWARSLRDQCKAAGAAFHFKQWGEYLSYGQVAPKLGDPRPGDEGEWQVHRDPEYRTNPYERWMARRPGKKLAGRLLDGVEHNGFPTSTP